MSRAMDLMAFGAHFGLTEGDGPGRWQVVLDDLHCTGPRDRRFLYGGMGVALCIEALQAQIGREIATIDVQFVGPSPNGSTLVLEVTRASGRSFVHAAVEGRVDGNLVLAGLASIRTQTGGESWDAPDRPQVPAPDECPVITAHAEAHEDVHALVEMRLVQGRFGIFSRAPVSRDGCVVVWMRRKGAYEPREPWGAAYMALIADFLPSTTSNSLNARAGGSSLDNMVRPIRPAIGEWLLVELVTRGIVDGIGHGHVEIRDCEGRLVAIGGQSFIARRR